MQQGSLFANADLHLWRTTLDAYDRALAAICTSKSSGQRLAELDKWYHETLPDLINSRKAEANSVFMTRDEVVKVTEWKLKRGKFRPRLQSLVESNTDAMVRKITSDSFAKLPNVKDSLRVIKDLKGVGPATASAILAAYSPLIPFMSDEAMEAIPGMGKIAYVEKYYLKYLENVTAKCDELNSGQKDFVWTPRLVERTLWTHTVCCRFGVKTSAVHSEVTGDPVGEIAGKRTSTSNWTETDAGKNNDDVEVEGAGKRRKIIKEAVKSQNGTGLRGGRTEKEMNLISRNVSHF
ncbi:hypothetical protein BC937DRAFT_87166 [Endogone sp. FLAS-F59071]|nr:hypothetical protein BC937DRAFT_87166 [Endogone sp. FLAS-F59071]|eukprot:RUS19640.1 hypothetical protein BC937DRAFT_87166 [Endogone sp. FLAS-F59071]